MNPNPQGPLLKECADRCHLDAVLCQLRISNGLNCTYFSADKKTTFDILLLVQ